MCITMMFLHQQHAPLCRDKTLQSPAALCWQGFQCAVVKQVHAAMCRKYNVVVKNYFCKALLLHGCYL